MSEIVFSYDMNIKKFKDFMSQKFSDKDLENIVDAIYMYIEIVSMEEMNNRIHSNLTNPLIENQLIWVKELAVVFDKFLKKTWQK